MFSRHCVPETRQRAERNTDRLMVAEFRFVSLASSGSCLQRRAPISWNRCQAGLDPAIQSQNSRRWNLLSGWPPMSSDLIRGSRAAMTTRGFRIISTYAFRHGDGPKRVSGHVPDTLIPLRNKGPSGVPPLPNYQRAVAAAAFAFADVSGTSKRGVIVRTPFPVSAANPRCSEIPNASSVVCKSE